MTVHHLSPLEQRPPALDDTRAPSRAHRDLRCAWPIDPRLDQAHANLVAMTPRQFAARCAELGITVQNKKVRRR